MLSFSAFTQTAQMSRTVAKHQYEQASTSSADYSNRQNNKYQRILFLLETHADLEPELITFREIHSEFDEQYQYTKDASLNNRLIDAAKTGDLATVQDLILNKKANPNKAESSTTNPTFTLYNRTALYHAIANGHIEVAGFLLTIPAVMDAINARSYPLFDYGHQSTYLTQAIHACNSKIVTVLLKVPGIDINTYIAFGTASTDLFYEGTALMQAMRLYRDYKQEFAKTNPQDLDHHKYKKCLTNITDIIQMLLNDPRIDVNVPCADGTTVLMEAAKLGLIEWIQPLIDKGAHVNAKNRNGWTAVDIIMFWSSRRLDQLIHDANAIIILLLRNGAIPERVIGETQLLDYLSTEQKAAMAEYQTYETSMVTCIMDSNQALSRDTANIIAQYLLLACADQQNTRESQTEELPLNSEDTAFRAWLARKAQAEEAKLSLKKQKIEGQVLEANIQSLEENNTGSNTESSTGAGAGSES